jgi:hypothetical protein
MSTTSVAPSKANPSYIILTADVRVDHNGSPSSSLLKVDGAKHHQMMERYDTDSFWVFEDGSFTSETRLLSLGELLPRATGAIPFAIELALTLSATERVRVFLVYDKDSKLESVCLVEETREGLFENRPPLAFTSLVGTWTGQSETLHRPTMNTPFSGFGKSNRRRPPVPVSTASMYSEDELPPELRAGSAGKDGLLRLKSSQVFGWDPSHNSVRRV